MKLLTRADKHETEIGACWLIDFELDNTPYEASIILSCP